jgi:hypothetical protein
MTKPAHRDQTPVDDVRRIRQRLSREAHGDVRKLAELSNRAFEKPRGKLKLKPAEPPTRKDRRNGTRG